MLRLINGWACVGVFLVVESWLLLAGDPKMRGRLLALYMIALYGSGMLGQVQLGAITQLGDMAPFMIAGLLASLSVMPMVIIPRISPLVERVEPLMPQHLIRMTPTGVMGCFGSGVAIAAVYTLLPCTCNASAWTWPMWADDGRGDPGRDGVAISRGPLVRPA